MTCLVLQILIFRFMRPARALHSTLVGFLLQCMGRLWWLPVHILAISKGVRNPRSKISSFCSPCCHEETPVHYLSVHLVSQVKLLLVFFCWTLLEEQKPLQKDRMNLTKPDKSIFASRLANPERRPRLASGWRPKPKERFRCTEERDETCGGQCDGGEVLTLSLGKQHGNQAGGIRRSHRPDG